MKNIIKTFGIIAFTAIIVFSFAACGGDGEETSPISAFAGTWNASNGRSIYINGNWFEYRVIIDKPYDGTFSVSGSKITFNATGKGAASGKYTLSGDTLTLSDHTWDNTVNGTYTKVRDDGDTVVKAMTFEEDPYWNETGHDERYRYRFQYKDETNPFDLSSMHANNKVYLFTYSFESDIDIDEFALRFQNETDWKVLSEWTTFLINVKKNTRYSGSFFIVPNNDAAGTTPTDNFLEFYVKNRDVTTPATVSFYQFNLEQVEIATLNSVTANGSAESTTTQLTLTLSKAITGLSADNITLSGVDGVTKGTLSGSGTTYTLPISGFTKGGTLSVALEKSGYVFKNWLMTATIYYKSGSGGGEDSGTFNSLDDFKNWLNGKGNNSASSPYNVKLNLPNLSGLLDFLKGLSGKFVKLDFSGSSFTSIGADAFKGLTNLTGLTLPSGITGIGANAFDGCTNLTDITLPSGVNSIGANAFNGCTNLNSVTFNGTITSGNFSSTNPFLGDLRDKYFSGGAGTYTRTSGGTTWTKQGGGGGSGSNGNPTVWTSVTSTTFTSSFNDIAWGSNKFVAVGGINNTIVYSSDGVNWTAATNSIFTNANSITWGKDKFVVAGSDGKIAYSPDGIAWTAVSNNPNISFRAITYGNNKFVAVGENNQMAYSTDGTTWTAVTNSAFTSYYIFGITYGNNKFVAVGGDGQMAYSTDGTSWTAVGNSTFGNNTNGSSHISGIAYGNNKFVAGGAGGKMATSADGITWTTVANSTFTYSIFSITYDGNKFVAGGEYGKMAYSSDGINWTAVTDSTFDNSSGNNIRGIAWGSNGSNVNKFVAVGRREGTSNFGKIAYWEDTPSGGGGSVNPTVWTNVSNTTFGSSQIEDIAWGNNKFVAVGHDGKMAYSSDGTSWTTVSNSTFGSNYIYGVTYGNGKFVAGGSSGKMAYSSDGINWTAVADSKFIYAGNYCQISKITWGNDKFVTVGQFSTMTYSSDGINWTKVDNTRFTGSVFIRGITYGNNKFVAVGGDDQIAYSSDGTSWTKVTDSKFGTSSIASITWGNNKFVAVGGDGKMAYSSDGTSWTTVTDSKFGTTSIATITYDNNMFVAGGANGKMAYSSDGINWTAIANTTFDSSQYNIIRGIAWGSNKFVAVGNDNPSGGSYNGKIAYSTGN